MPFKLYRPSVVSQRGGVIFLPELVSKTRKTKSGDVTELSIDYVRQNKELPDKSSTDLAVQLRAGVPLKQVNTKILTPSSVDLATLPIDKDSGKENKSKQEQTNNKQEQTNNGEN